MLRCGISLPALKELMGNKDIRMTLRYLKITQPDLQREFYRVRHNAGIRFGQAPSVSVVVLAEPLYRSRMRVARRSNSSFHITHNSILPCTAREQPPTPPVLPLHPSSASADAGS